jgi:hypothetical protein
MRLASPFGPAKLGLGTLLNTNDSAIRVARQRFIVGLLPAQDLLESLPKLLKSMARSLPDLT